MALIADKQRSIGQRINTVQDVMEANAKTMFAALPQHISVKRMIRVAISSIRKNPRLLDCNPASLFDALTEASTLGLECDGVLGQAYLVPFKEEVVLIPGYKGLIDLARRSANISTLFTRCVYKGDHFDYAEGDAPYLKHKPSEAANREDQAVTHVYCVCRLRDGGVQRSVWTTAKIDRHKERFSQAWRNAEKGRKDSAWHTDWEAMARKTVVREMINRGEIPVSVEVQRLAGREQLYEASTTTIDAQATTVSDIADLLGPASTPGIEQEPPKRSRKKPQEAAHNESGADTEETGARDGATEHPAVSTFRSWCGKTTDFDALEAEGQRMAGELPEMAQEFEQIVQARFAELRKPAKGQGSLLT